MALPRFYFPGARFPAISVTGSSCALACKHCNGHYLRGMLECMRPEKLVELARELERRGANGFLLSGGCDARGRIPLDGFYAALRKIKDSSDLSINLHVGLLRPDEAHRVVETGVDAISVDVIGDDSTIREVCNLKARKEDYGCMMTSLSDAGGNLVPHITAGLHFGTLRGEEEALSMIRDAKPKMLVVNSLLPTRNTPMENVESSAEDYLTVLSSARSCFPSARIIMGCMRPRNARVEREALRMGIDGIALPRRRIMEVFPHRRLETCCGMAY